MIILKYNSPVGTKYYNLNTYAYYKFNDSGEYIIPDGTFHAFAKTISYKHIVPNGTNIFIFDYYFYNLFYKILFYEN